MLFFLNRNGGNTCTLFPNLDAGMNQWFCLLDLMYFSPFGIFFNVLILLLISYLLFMKCVTKVSRYFCGGYALLVVGLGVYGVYEKLRIEAML